MDGILDVVAARSIKPILVGHTDSELVSTLHYWQRGCTHRGASKSHTICLQVMPSRFDDLYPVCLVKLVKQVMLCFGGVRNSKQIYISLSKGPGLLSVQEEMRATHMRR